MWSGPSWGWMMGKDSKISWTHHTFNSWWGCTKESEGCSRCYAETWARRWGYDIWGPETDRRFFGDNHWNEPRRWDKRAGLRNVRERVFCGSMCDVFEDRRDLDIHRSRLWELIDNTPNLDWLLLTKRPKNITRLIPHHYWSEMFGWPATNVRLGVTVEHQKTEWRIADLLEIAGSTPTFLSLEPMLGPIDLKHWIRHVNHVIIGGESGPKRRPFDPDWARQVRDLCAEHEVPFYMKQMDKVIPIPNDLMIRQFPDDGKV